MMSSVLQYARARPGPILTLSGALPARQKSVELGTASTEGKKPTCLGRVPE